MSARTSTVVICAVVLMHVYQAVMMLIFPSAGGATGLLALLAAMRAINSPDGQHFVAAVVMAAAVSGAVAALFQVGWWRLAMLLPQQVLLGIQAGGGICATVLGHYLDGVAIPWPHISVDQIPLATLFLIHISAILRRVRY